MKKISQLSLAEIGKCLELFILNPTVTEKEVDALVEKSIQYNLRGIVAPMKWTAHIKNQLAGTGIKVGSGGSFPFGADSPRVKELIAKECMEAGCEDIELPMNYSALISGDIKTVEEEVALARKATEGAELKMIIECCMLNDDQIKQACKIMVDNGVDFVKSSTGQIKGPTLEQACLIVDCVKGTNTHSKVSGVSFPKPQNALMYLMAGIEVLGSQNPFEIVDGIDFIQKREIMW